MLICGDASENKGAVWLNSLHPKYLFFFSAGRSHAVTLLQSFFVRTPMITLRKQAYSNILKIL